MQCLSSIGLCSDGNKVASLFRGPLEAVLKCRDVFCGKLNPQTILIIFQNQLLKTVYRETFSWLSPRWTR